MAANMDNIESQPSQRRGDQVQGPLQDSDRYDEGQQPPRKRARLSCNTCKARKTKAGCLT
jgi:hypothetical protein